jgi:hypothetical protein
MWKELDYPEGSMLFDVRYYKKPEKFEIIYLSPITHQLEVKYEEPIVDIWFLKEEYRTNEYQITQAEIDKCYPVYCKVSQIAQAIAINIGGEYKEYFDKNSSTMSSNDLKNHMCKCPWVFKADFVPDVYFRLRWLKKYGDTIDVSQVTYGFVDIEADVLDKTINLRDLTDVTQPVNAVTIILPHVKICAVLILGPRPKYKIHPKFEMLLHKQKVEYDWLVNHQEEFKQMIVEEDDDNKKYIKDYDIRLHIFDFNEEINLIKTVFDYINKYRPMFCLSWNAKFDHPYLMNRIGYLGYDPKDIIIPKEFKTDKLFYSEDKSDSFSVKTSKDWFFTSTYTVYMCQMRLFAAIRKSQQERRSYALTSVGKDMAGIVKLSNTKSGTFREFAYTDFIKFILYNIRDVVVQLAIEMKCNDCQSLVSRSYMFATQYSKCFQETHIVRNHREDSYEEEGFVQANKLIVDPTIDTAFKGAFVAPTVNNAPTGQIVNGKHINNMMYAVLDADAASYYPSMKMSMNMDGMSILYKCKINNDVFTSGQCINHSFNQAYLWYDSKNKPHAEDLTGPIINSYKSKNEMSLLNNFFNLPTVAEYFEHIDSRLS